MQTLMQLSFRDILYIITQHKQQSITNDVIDITFIIIASSSKHPQNPYFGYPPKPLLLYQPLRCAKKRKKTYFLAGIYAGLKHEK